MNVYKGGVPMRKYFILLLVTLVTLLSGCMSSDMEPEEIDNPIGKPYGSSLTTDMFFEWGTLTYRTTYTSDILYGFTSPEYDYLYVISEDESFSEQKLQAYQDTFEMLVELDSIVASFSLIELDKFSTDEIKTMAEANEIEVTAYDIFTFSSIKEDFVSNQTNYYHSRITKFEYIEKRLSTELSEDDEAALLYLQDVVNDVTEVSYEFIFYQMNTFDQFLMHLENDISFVPNIEEKLLLEQAFDLMQQMK